MSYLPLVTRTVQDDDTTAYCLMVLVLVDFAIELLAKEAVAKRATNANNNETFFIFFNFKDLSNGNTPVQFDLLHLTLSFKEDCQNFKLSAK